MKILICDDEPQYVDDLKTHVEAYMNSHYVGCEIDCFTSPLAVADNTTAYDLAFLDIQMDALDGFALAKKLRFRNGKLIVFYITSYNEFQDTAMDSHAFRFFEKPFDPERFTPDWTRRWNISTNRTWICSCITTTRRNES